MEEWREDKEGKEGKGECIEVERVKGEKGGVEIAKYKNDQGLHYLYLTLYSSSLLHVFVINPLRPNNHSLLLPLFTISTDYPCYGVRESHNGDVYLACHTDIPSNRALVSFLCLPSPSPPSFLLLFLSSSLSSTSPSLSFMCYPFNRLQLTTNQSDGK